MKIKCIYCGKEYKPLMKSVCCGSYECKKEYQKEYRQSDKYKEYLKKYEQSSKRKESRKRYYQINKKRFKEMREVKNK